MHYQNYNAKSNKVYKEYIYDFYKTNLLFKLDKESTVVFRRIITYK